MREKITGKCLARWMAGGWPFASNGDHIESRLLWREPWSWRVSEIWETELPISVLVTRHSERASDRSSCQRTGVGQRGVAVRKERFRRKQYQTLSSVAETINRMELGNHVA